MIPKITEQQLEDAKAGRFSPNQTAVVSITDDLKSMTDRGVSEMILLDGVKHVLVVGICDGKFYFAARTHGDGSYIFPKDLRSISKDRIKGYVPTLANPAFSFGIDNPARYEDGSEGLMIKGYYSLEDDPGHRGLERQVADLSINFM